MDECEKRLNFSLRRKLNITHQNTHENILCSYLQWKGPTRRGGGEKCRELINYDSPTITTTNKNSTENTKKKTPEKCEEWKEQTATYSESFSFHML